MGLIIMINCWPLFHYLVTIIYNNMKISQVDTTTFKIDDEVFNHSEITYSKGYLEKALAIVEKQRLAVANATIMLESSENKLHIAELNYRGLLLKPYDVNTDELPEEVNIKTNLGTSEEPLWLTATIPKGIVAGVLKRNPNYSFENPEDKYHLLTKISD